MTNKEAIAYVKDVPDLKMTPHFCENCNADMRGKDNDMRGKEGWAWLNYCLS